MGFITVFGATVLLSQVVSVAVTVASMAYQISQAKKARKAAAAAAEARKGFEMVIDGEVSTLPIVYGKALVGGTRVYHSVGSSFKNATANSDTSFVTGPPGAPGGSYTYWEDDGNGQFVERVQDYPPTSDGLLNRDLSGEKNEFLYFQQAICQGPIAKVWDIIINESQFIDDPALGTSKSKVNFTPGRGSGYRAPSDVKAALRVDVHYAGGEACALMNANASGRASSVFSETAYATVAIRLDRDEPQFNGVPSIQFLVEGSLVRRVFNGALTERDTYSNNPAWCLLDYLMHSRSGKGLDISQLDLASFEAAAAVCDTIVQSQVHTGGKIHRPTNQSRDLRRRDLPLYECNIIIDAAKPIRENVESILSTMGDARLVWSGGKYKLLLQYPANNAAIQVATTLTDDDIERGSPVEVSWPSSSERLNSCTVRFHNEAENFKEDSVSWPSKVSGESWRGVDGDKYDLVSGWASDNTLMNSYGVWDGSADTASFRWLIRPIISSNYTFKAQGDDAWTMEIVGKTTLSNTFWTSPKETTVYLEANTEYIIQGNCSNGGGLKGIAATLTTADGNIFWSTRDTSYSAYILTSTSDTVYRTMLTEDQDISLETDIFADGVTDYYHALAKAEELVRTSRSAFGIKLSYIIKNNYLEPGDIIKVQSNTLKLGVAGDLYIRVNELKVSEGGICEVTGTRFDWTQLAWNVKDNEYLKPNNAYEFNLPAPQRLTYVADTNEVKGSAGSLEWPHVSDSRRVGYVLYAHVAGDMDASGGLSFNEIGRAVGDRFSLPNYVNASMIFGVRTLSSTGALSGITLTSSTNATFITGPTPPTVTVLSAEVTGDQNDAVILNWTIPAAREDATEYLDHYITQIYRSKVDDFTTATLVGQTEISEFTERPTNFGQLFYWVKLISLRGVKGTNSASASVTIDSAAIGEDMTPPPTPTGFTVTSMFSTFQLSWDQPAYTIGRGHDRTLIYAAPWPVGSLMPVFNASKPSASSVGTLHNYPSALGTRMVFWITWQSKGGGRSAVPAGPITAQTGLVGNADLGPLIIEADNIAENGVDLSKFAEGIEPVKIVTSLPVTKQTEVVVFEGKIYRWDGTKYSAGVATVDLTGQITNVQIANQAVDLTKFANGLQPATIVDGTVVPTVKSTEIITVNGKVYRWNGTAYTAEVAAVDLTGQITNTQISDDSISTPKLRAGSIETDKLAANAITADKIAANSIVAGHLQAGVISTDKLAADAVTAYNIAADNINSVHLQSNAVTATKIAADSITAVKIAAYSIETDKLATNAVTADKIAANSIAAGHLQAGIISTDKLAANAVTAAKISAGAIAVGSAAIANGAIRNALIENGAIDNAKIANAAITTAKIGVAQVDTLRIGGAAVTTTNYQEGGGNAVSAGGITNLVDIWIDMGQSITSQSGVVIQGNLRFMPYDNASMYARIYRIRDGQTIGFAEMSGSGGYTNGITVFGFDAHPVPGGNGYRLAIQNPSSGPGSNVGAEIKGSSIVATGGKR